jgi:hypothetical protein
MPGAVRTDPGEQPSSGADRGGQTGREKIGPQYSSPAVALADRFNENEVRQRKEGRHTCENQLFLTSFLLHSDQKTSP